MSDLISRQNALDALKKIMFTHLFECGEYIGEDTRECSIVNAEKALDVIENLPSAEPERTAKVVEHDASVTDTDGYKYHRSEYLCGACKKKVLGGDDYCSHCGARLEWE